MRKEDPSVESQKPLTCQVLAEEGKEKSPSKDTSVKGFPASGEEIMAESSKMSKASTERAGAEKVTSWGAERRVDGANSVARKSMSAIVRERRMFIRTFQGATGSVRKM